MQINSRSHWDTYYETDTDFTYISQSELDELFGYIDDTLPKQCLDIGCGTGQLSRELFHRGFSVLGIDVSGKAIARAKQASTYTGKGLEYSCMDFEQEKWPGNQTFSLITCKLVYAFIKDRAAFLQKVAGLLSPGGIFVIITPIKETTSPEKAKIAVDYQETLGELERHFTVTTFASRGVEYFVCRHH